MARVWMGMGMGEEVGVLPRFAVLTTAARSPVREIHDRMPVVPGAERARVWLSRGGRPEGEAIELVGREVSGRVNLAANDDAGLNLPLRLFAPPRSNSALHGQQPRHYITAAISRQSSSSPTRRWCTTRAARPRHSASASFSGQTLCQEGEAGGASGRSTEARPNAPVAHRRSARSRCSQAMLRVAVREPNDRGGPPRRATFASKNASRAASNRKEAMHKMTSMRSGGSKVAVAVLLILGGVLATATACTGSGGSGTGSGGNRTGGRLRPLSQAMNLTVACGARRLLSSSNGSSVQRRTRTCSSRS